jgi:putative copper export protein
MEDGGVSVSKSTKLLCIFVVLLSGLLLNWVIMHYFHETLERELGRVVLLAVVCGILFRLRGFRRR